MQNVKESLSSKETSKTPKTRDDDRLTVKEDKKKGWLDEKNKGKFKSKNKNLKYFQCHGEEYFKRDVPKRKYKVKESKERSGDAAVVFDEQKEGYDSVGVLVASCN